MKDWDYSELSKAAKAAGGPEEYVKSLKESSRQQGRNEMLPWIVVASLFTAGFIKIKNELKTRKENKNKEIETELIEGIKEYDIKNTSEEGGEENEQEISEC